DRATQPRGMARRVGGESSGQRAVSVAVIRTAPTVNDRNAIELVRLRRKGELQARVADFRLADGGDLAKLRPAAELSRFLVMFPLAHFFLHPAPWEKLLEPPQSGADRLPVVDAHSQRHTAGNLLARAANRPVAWIQPLVERASDGTGRR